MTKTIERGMIQTLRALPIRKDELESLPAATCLVARKSTRIIPTAIPIVVVKFIAAIAVTVVVTVVIISCSSFSLLQTSLCR